MHEIVVWENTHECLLDKNVGFNFMTVNVSLILSNRQRTPDNNIILKVWELCTKGQVLQKREGKKKSNNKQNEATIKVNRIAYKKNL